MMSEIKWRIEGREDSERNKKVKGEKSVGMGRRRGNEKEEGGNVRKREWERGEENERGGRENRRGRKGREREERREREEEGEKRKGEERKKREQDERRGGKSEMRIRDSR